MKRITFQTRARTIDHLGRGQIADCPTAVSELWKNSFDAYARNVELQIFDGDPKVAAIFDDGFGMTRDDFLNRWLVIGTESKIDEKKIISSERFGIPERPRQGEKGIGRLSAAFLAPVNLIISKKAKQSFAAALVDWRLFENPFLTLEDLSIPVEEFERPEEIFELLPNMVAIIKENLTGEGGTKERRERLREGWDRYDEYEKSQKVESTVRQRIRDFPLKGFLQGRHLTEWPVFLNLEEHGTALFLIDVHRELGIWVDDSVAANDDEVATVKRDLKRTLTGFTDPYAEKPLDFAYTVRVNLKDKHHSILTSEEVFDLNSLRNLEHVLEGEFDEKGTFRGKLRVFGKERGECIFNPSRTLPQKVGDRLGKFSFCVGTYEQDQKNSTHSPEEYGFLENASAHFSGLTVYRDGLRVMPYGRPDADFFMMEERRARNAGREFWTHRRCFGRVAFTREENPNLRDKAGREGLVDNRARREMRLLVMDLLMEAARRYFGSSSDIRETELPEIQKRNELAREAAERARKNRRRSFRKHLKEQRTNLMNVVATARSLQTELEEDGLTAETLALASERYQSLRGSRDQLRLPPLPAKLADDEEEYRSFRDQYNDFVARLENIGSLLATQSERVQTQTPGKLATSHLQSNQSQLNEKLLKYLKQIKASLETIREVWARRNEADRALYFERAHPVLQDLDKGSRLATVLNTLDAYYYELDQSFAFTYDPFLRTLENLIEGVDLEGALSITDDERIHLEDKLTHVHSLAQLGIAVEIIGHELETLDSEVGRNLKRLPLEVQKLQAFKLAYEAHRALVERLRFLAPLKLAGYRPREIITGDNIKNYVENFFGRHFRDSRVDFQATDRFRHLAISDLPSRIYPVFINLINNAIYWLNFVEKRKILLDLIDGKVIVADSGKGIDPDDISRLFELFFTRRAEGRGVGLYLCRVNLAVAHHKIWYAGSDDPKILPGANFIIQFRGIKE